MDFKFSNHALTRLKRRNISAEKVLQVINNPDSISIQDKTITVYSKLVREESKTYLYRVFVNQLKNPYLVITAYKTSKIKKYGN
ncbi:MAG: DUF4258 domain-containing protein [Prolixibacteraceae bacterium]